MLTRIKHLLEMIRFSHTLFALPFALLAFVMAVQWRSYMMASAMNELGRALATYSAKHDPPEKRVVWTESERPPAIPDSPRFLRQDVPKLLGILLCMVFARSAAMAVRSARNA